MMEVFYKFSKKALRLHPNVFDEFDRFRLVKQNGKVGLFGFFRTIKTINEFCGPPQCLKAGVILGAGTRVIDSYIKLCNETETEELLQLVDSLQEIASDSYSWHYCQGKITFIHKIRIDRQGVTDE